MQKWKKMLALVLAGTMYFSAVGLQARAEEGSLDSVIEGQAADTEEEQLVPEEEVPTSEEEVTDQETEENREEEAAGEDHVSPVEQSEEESVADVVLEEGKAVNFVYVESPEVTYGETENIVFSVGDEENSSLQEGTLLLETPAGEDMEIVSSKKVDSLLLFSVPIDENTILGDYTLKSLKYQENNVGYEEKLEDEWSYTVAESSYGQIQTYAAEAPQEDGIISSEDAISKESLESALSSLHAVAGEEGVTVDITHYDRSSNGDLVVVLDPGHDNKHVGASRGNLKEQDITLSLAWYAKDALEQYSGVKVYMTRSGANCPVGGGDNKNCLLYRTQYAASVNADLFVSFHINSTAGSSTSSHGAMVFVPNYSKYNGTMTSLSKKILNQLHALGLSNKGVQINADDHTNGKYDDGNWQDDYSVIRNSVLRGFPGILIEHAFINNTGDQMILASESMLKKIGEGDAEAIAQHYGLKKGGSTASSDQVKNFVNRMYEKVLNRGYDQDGQNYWTGLLTSGQISGATMAEKFVFSPEFTGRGLNNEQFLNILYEAFFGRTADSSGMVYWKNMLETGVSRRGVCARFIMSEEFTQICSSYGITKGSIAYTEDRDINPSVTGFVYRCYNKTLDREPDTDGINYWCKVINNHQFSAKEVAGKFVFSQEFKNKNLNNTDYIKVLYRVFMGREYDNGGLNYWNGKLSAGSSREAVFESFAGSKEFSLILQSFGL